MTQEEKTLFKNDNKQNINDLTLKPLFIKNNQQFKKYNAIMESNVKIDKDDISFEKFN